MKIAMLILFGLAWAWFIYNGIVVYICGRKIKQLGAALNRFNDACERGDDANVDFFNREFDRIHAECKTMERRTFLL